MGPSCLVVARSHQSQESESLVVQFCVCTRIAKTFAFNLQLCVAKGQRFSKQRGRRPSVQRATVVQYYRSLLARLTTRPESLLVESWLSAPAISIVCPVPRPFRGDGLSSLPPGSLCSDLRACGSISPGGGVWVFKILRRTSSCALPVGRWRCRARRFQGEKTIATRHRSCMLPWWRVRVAAAIRQRRL